MALGSLTSKSVAVTLLDKVSQTLELQGYVDNKYVQTLAQQVRLINIFLL